jgi:signal recognition particle receptor subunit beta
VLLCTVTIVPTNENELKVVRMQNPEILLKNLNTALCNLRGAANLLGDDDDARIDSKFLPVMRKLLLAEVLGNTAILAIGGSQGAGKTTFLTSLYNLDTGDSAWLKPNEGRGEKLPVLIVEEKGRIKVEGTVRHYVKVDEHYELQDVSVSTQEFQDATSGKNPAALLPVLKVPKRYFDSPQQAWLLLPGYEKENRDNKEWQIVMRQALIAATGCIVVTDKTRMANQQQAEIVKDMLSNELRGVQALIVISKTEDERDKPEGLQQLRATAQEVFQVPPESAERWIVCTGTHPDYAKQWRPLVEKAIKDLTISSSPETRSAQLKQLETVINRDLSSVITFIKNKTDLFFARESISEGTKTLQDALEKFDDAKADLREKYHSELEKLLTNHCHSAWENLQNTLKNDYEGLGKKVSNFFSGTTITEESLRIESDLRKAWETPGSILEKHADVLAQVTQKSLGAPTLTPLQKSGTPLQRLGYVGDDEQVTSWKTLEDGSVQKNLRAIFDLQGIAPALDKECIKAFKLLPAITLEYARVASMMPALVGVDPTSLAEVAATERPHLIQAAVKHLGDGVDVSKTVLSSIATILAVDIAGDGDVDSIPAILNVIRNAVGLGTPAAANATATGIATATRTAAMSGIGAAMVGTIAVGYLVHSVIRDIRIHDGAVQSKAQQMLMSVRDHHLTHFLEHFDDLMKEVRGRLEDALRKRYRLDESFWKRDHLVKALADAETLKDGLLRELGQSGQTIALWDSDVCV